MTMQRHLHGGRQTWRLRRLRACPCAPSGGHSRRWWTMSWSACTRGLPPPAPGPQPTPVPQHPPSAGATPAHHPTLHELALLMLAGAMCGLRCTAADMAPTAREQDAVQYCCVCLDRCRPNDDMVAVSAISTDVCLITEMCSQFGLNSFPIMYPDGV